MSSFFVGCDRCPSAGREAWEKDIMLLVFCGHHANKHRAALIGQGWRCTDLAD